MTFAVASAKSTQPSVILVDAPAAAASMRKDCGFHRDRWVTVVGA